MDIAQLNSLLSLGTLGLEVAAVIFLVVYLFPSLIPGAADIRTMIGTWGLWVALLLILMTAAANFYYESFGFEPCPLCWWQRIFLYPQAVLLALALWRADAYKRATIDFSIVLCVIGAGVALYQHALQMLPGSGLPCPATGASCATRILFEFGHITYPWMAFVLFAFLIVLMFISRSQRTS